jgi:hypothetical protein
VRPHQPRGYPRGPRHNLPRTYGGGSYLNTPNHSTPSVGSGCESAYTNVGPLMFRGGAPIRSLSSHKKGIAYILNPSIRLCSRKHDEIGETAVFELYGGQESSEQIIFQSGVRVAETNKAGHICWGLKRTVFEGILNTIKHVSLARARVVCNFWGRNRFLGSSTRRIRHVG